MTATISLERDDALCALDAVWAWCPPSLEALLCQVAPLCQKIAAARRAGTPDPEAEQELAIMYGRAQEQLHSLTVRVEMVRDAVTAVRTAAKS